MNIIPSKLNRKNNGEEKGLDSNVDSARRRCAIMAYSRNTTTWSGRAPVWPSTRIRTRPTSATPIGCMKEPEGRVPRGRLSPCGHPPDGRFLRRREDAAGCVRSSHPRDEPAVECDGAPDKIVGAPGRDGGGCCCNQTGGSSAGSGFRLGESLAKSPTARATAWVSEAVGIPPGGLFWKS